MSVVVNATADIVGRTANLPSYTSFTHCGWARVLNDQGSGTSQPLIVPANGPLTDAIGIYWDSSTSAGNMRIFTAVGGAETSGTNFGSRPAVGTDFFWYLRCSGTGAGLLQGGWRAAGSNTFTQATATLSGSPSAAATWRHGNVGSFFYLDSKHWNSKCWDRALTDDELMIESFFARVMFPSSINWHWPLKNANDTRDLGGLGRAPTFAGTITTDDELPLFAPRRRIFLPAGGNVTASLTGQSGSLSSGTVTPANSLALSGQGLTSGQGTASPSTSVNVSGAAITAAAGTAVPDLQVALTGQFLTASQGTLTANVGGDVTLALTGQALATTAGSLVPATDKAATGSALSSSAGTLTPNASAVLAGQALALAQGTITFVGDVTVALTGLSMNLGQGLLSVPGAVAEGPTPAGKGRKRYFVEIDGQTFEVRDVQHAQALLDRAREMAARHAQELASKAVPVTRKVGKKPIPLPTPRISSPDPDLKEIVREARQKINAVYRQAAIDTELAYLMARQLELDDEEEALLLLM